MSFSNAQLVIADTTLFSKTETSELEGYQIPRLLANIPALRLNEDVDDDTPVVQVNSAVSSRENQKLDLHAPIQSFPDRKDEIEQWRLHQILLNAINNHRNPRDLAIRLDFNEELEIAETIESVADLLGKFNMAKSAGRLRVLKSYEEDLEEGCKPLNLESVKNYAEFRNAFEDFGEPLLGVSPDGILGADWKLDSGHYIGLSFKPDGQVIYAVVFPSADPDSPEHMYGRANHQKIIGVLRAKDLFL